MADLLISDDVAERLLEVAQQENRPVNELLRSMLDEHVAHSEQPVSTVPTNKMAEFLGAFDDDVPDISSNVRETLDEYYRKKYGTPNTD